MANRLNRTLQEKYHEVAIRLRGFWKPDLADEVSAQSGTQSRLPGYGPLSVIDIGSNSVRLVTYERLSRSPTPIFNEKSLCGLGSGLSQTGELKQSAIDDALSVIHRFKTISDQLGSVDLIVLATAATREATNGGAFIERVAEICKTRPYVLSGSDEARFSGYGILAGFHEPDGVMGDMGGGSLELADIRDGAVGEGATYPLGGLRLRDMSDNKPLRAAAIAGELLAGSDILKAGAGRTFYAIGGTWRSLGSLHMRQNDYPLRVLHHYEVPAEKMAAFCELILKSDIETIRQIESVSKSRTVLLRFGAAVLLAVIRKMQPSVVIMSALGVREGVLYDQLSEDVRVEDGLIAGAEDLSLLRSRSPKNTYELIEWTDSLFQVAGLQETKEQKRLREAACLLSDIGWRAHPDYRGEECLNTISHAAFIGVDHPGRAFIALSAYFRHEGQFENGVMPPLASLITQPGMMNRARLLGFAFRIAHLLTASMAGTLLKTRFTREDDMLILELDQIFTTHIGERLTRRIAQISKLLDRKVEIRVRDARDFEQLL